MSFWMEVRCDVNLRGCYSESNLGARGFGKVDLVAQAKRSGWKITRKGHATCPFCLKADTV